MLRVFKYFGRKPLAVLLFLLMLPCPSFAVEEPAGAEYGPLYTEYFPDIYLHEPCFFGPAVIEIQEALKTTGYFQGNPSGFYDEDTAQAVRKFQQDQGLGVDGAVRYHVWLKLAAKLKQSAKKDSLPPPPGEVEILVDTFRRKLIVLNDGLPYAAFSIAIGKAITPSPLGNWKVRNKGVNIGPAFGTRWMGLDVPWGVYGIHGTNNPWSIGSMASHGCFRMWNRDVEVLYPWIDVGTQVTVVGNPFGYMSGGLQRLKPRDNGSAAKFIQQKLRNRGFYQGKPDGLYGPSTENAVKKLQKHYHLRQTGEVGHEEYNILGVL